MFFRNKIIPPRIKIDCQIIRHQISFNNMRKNTIAGFSTVKMPRGVLPNRAPEKKTFTGTITRIYFSSYSDGPKKIIVVLKEIPKF